MDRKPTFTDYLSILYRWKKFLLINLLIVGLITTGITFLIPEKFKSDATIMIQEDENSGLLSNVMSSAGSLLGGALFGSGNTSVDKIFGYLESREIFLKVVQKFKLIQYYGFSNYKLEKTLKALKDDANFDLTENGFIEISMIHESPDTACLIVNYFISALDSLNKKITSAHATSYRKFIEKRYDKNLADIKTAELKFKEFQQKYKIYSVPEQIQTAFEVIAKLEGELAQKELEAELVGFSQGKGSSNYKTAKEQVELFKQKLNEITSGKSDTDESLIYFSFKDIPEVEIKYLHLFREIEIQNKLLEFILPMYEQAVMEELKDVPTIITIDKPFVPSLKEYPKRAFIILGILTLILFILIFFVFRAEMILTKSGEYNVIENKEKAIYFKLKSLYKV